jgi:anti-anti-sigma factor
VTVARGAGEARVSLAGELDVATVAALRVVLFELLEDCTRLVVDLCHLRFLDLPGVHLLCDAAAAAASRRGRLELEGATGDVARLLGLLRSRRPLLLHA